MPLDLTSERRVQGCTVSRILWILPARQSSSGSCTPRAQIAGVGDAESDVKKRALFENVGQGSVRALTGSTQKMRNETTE
jgi:hypothetical protein